MNHKIKFYHQHDQMDCGPACLAMVASHYGKYFSLQQLREYSFITREGVSLNGINEAANKIGFETFIGKVTVDDLKQNNHLPAIIHWNQNHFVVLHDIKKNSFNNSYSFYIADPGHGFTKLTEEQFTQNWISDDNKGVIMLLDPSDQFDQIKVEGKQLNFGFLIKYLLPYKTDLIKLILALFIGSAFTLVFPILTEALIDQGIAKNSLSIVFSILLAQIFLFLGSTVLEIVRNYTVLYIGTRIDIAIISEFITKLLKLPIGFFDTKIMGDFNQRIQDHERIEQFLTSDSLTTLFSIINFSVFFFVLFIYSPKILLTYFVLTIIAISWTFLFYSKRKLLDYYRFQVKAENQESIFEMINGIQEIKINRYEKYFLKQWESIQLNLFKTNTKVLRLDQLQVLGFDLINQFKNIIVTYIAAREVIQGNITLGAMLSISFIIGQMNSPIDQLISFFRSFQDSKLSMERLFELQNQDEEDSAQKVDFDSLLINDGIRINQLGFQYEGPNSPFVLEDIDAAIPNGKVTAIVGASGSGKTTLMKLLLKFYAPTNGEITINEQSLENLRASNWRDQCGVVMQEGYIFADTIERNIATGEESIDESRLLHAIKTANIESYIEGLPLGLKTKIGSSGIGVSGGQKQRILIARAVYKNPNYLFFDEATSALDAENERVIHDNLQQFFTNKTVVIIAHRLSTVKNADQILVLQKGKLAEQGNHETLVDLKGIYYNLVKNQLELGS